LPERVKSKESAIYNLRKVFNFYSTQAVEDRNGKEGGKRGSKTIWVKKK